MNDKNQIGRLSRRDFIFSPYLVCPNCNRSNSFGVLMVLTDRYVRECRECSYRIEYSLPRLNKKIIYLDQFVISEMMKAINGSLGKTEKVDDFWLTLFEKLNVLSRLQLIICPSSFFHVEESLLSEYEPLKKMYEHLSSGITFYDAETIKRFQICVAFNRWLGNTEKTKEITIEDIISGNFNNWPEPFRISVNLKFPEKDIDELRRVRETTQSEIANVFTRWQGEKSKKFRDWFMEEGRSFGRGVLKLYGEAAAKLFKHQIGLISLTAEDISSQILNANATLMAALLRYTSMQKDQEDFKEDFAKVRTFLLSDEMLKVPFIKIGSRLWAAIAERAANDSTRKPPNKGMVSDINMVACLLPYCDAIFVDREMFGLLDYGQVKQEIQKDFKTRVFSASNREDFLKYLENILTEADPKITSMAKELYGEPKPYYTMYEN